jgi:hypothetical protein
MNFIKTFSIILKFRKFNFLIATPMIKLHLNPEIMSTPQPVKQIESENSISNLKLEEMIPFNDQNPQTNSVDVMRNITDEYPVQTQVKFIMKRKNSLQLIFIIIRFLSLYSYSKYSNLHLQLKCLKII